VNTADRQGRPALRRIKRIIVGDDQCVTVPNLVLQTNRPNHFVGAGRLTQFFASDVRAGELNVLELHRDADLEFLHALVHQAVSYRRAATHDAVADRDQIEDIGDDPGRKTFAGDGQLPVGLFRSVSQDFIRAVRQPVHRNLAQAGKRTGPEPDSGRGSRANLRRLFRCAGHAQGQDADLFRKILKRLFQLHVEPARTQHAGVKTYLEFAIARLPIFHAIAVHISHGEPGLRRQFERVDAGFFDVERDAVGNHQPRFFQPGVHPVGNADDGFDGFEPECQRERPRVEPVGGDGIVRRIDLAQTGE